MERSEALLWQETLVCASSVQISNLKLIQFQSAFTLQGPGSHQAAKFRTARKPISTPGTRNYWRGNNKNIINCLRSHRWCFPAMVDVQRSKNLARGLLI